MALKELLRVLKGRQIWVSHDQFIEVEDLVRLLRKEIRRDIRRKEQKSLKK